MTDTAPQGQPADTGNTGVVEGQGSNEHSLYGEFLNEVPEEQRPLAEPWVKKWDAQVTRKFQELHEGYKPYKDLGAEPETLQQALAIYELLDTDPGQVYNALKELMEEGEANTPPVQTPPVESQNSPVKPEAFQGLPPELKAQMDQQQQMLEVMAKFLIDQQSQSTQQKEDQELEAYLSALKQQHGEFDEDYVLTKMANGASGEDAVKAYNALVQSKVNEASSATTPPVLSGGGAVPQETQKVTDLSKDQTKSLVASFLATANQNGRD